MRGKRHLKDVTILKHCITLIVKYNKGGAIMDDKALTIEFVRVTEHAAISVARFIGRGAKKRQTGLP
jgi:Bacterial fructose-1,6-bisphosphatase, glpX-encoded.